MIEFTADWFSFTVPNGNEGRLIERILDKYYREGLKAIPQRGYTLGLEFDHGMKVSWNQFNTNMGVHFTMSGGCLLSLASHGLHWKQIAEMVYSDGGRMSRVDLAIDFREEGAKFEDFAKAKQLPYRGKGNKPKRKGWHDEFGGWTEYFGSRSSVKFLRIYRKDTQLGLTGQNWIRAEIELKGEYAHSAGAFLATNTIPDCLRMSQGLIRGMADFTSDYWKRGLWGDAVGLALPDDKERDTLGWLLKSCAPALAKEIARDITGRVWDLFLEETKKSLKKLSVDGGLRGDDFMV